MPNPNKVFPQKFNELNVGDFIYLFFFFSIVGTTYLFWNQVRAGQVYGILMALSLASLFLLTIFKQEEDRPSRYVAMPFVKRRSLSIFFYGLGRIVPLILFPLLLGSLSFSIVPLFTADIVEANQPLAVAQLEASMPFKLFNIVFVAGTDESIVYNWLLVLFSIVVVVSISRLFTKESKKGFSRGYVMTLAYLLSIVLFMLSHQLNQSYIGLTQFLMAGGFLLISNVSMFEWGLPISFWKGFHQSNNEMYLINSLGLAAVANGYLSLYGAIVSIINIGVLFYIVNNWDTIVKDLKWWWNT